MIPVIIAGLENDYENFEYKMDELSSLAYANNMEVIVSVKQKLEHPIAATYFGKGKAEEIRHVGEINDIDTLIVNAELTPTQLRSSYW